MKNLLATALALLTAVQCTVALCATDADERTDGEAAKARHGPADVEIHLRDGSMVVGQLTSTDALELKTAYGTLTFPLASIVVLHPAIRASKENTEEIASAIKNLDSDEYIVRGRAQEKLEELGSRAAPLLRDARPKASAEARGRIEALLKKITAQNPKLMEDDVIKSNEFEAIGKLQIEALTLKNRIGELKVKLGDIESVRWLARGAAKSVTLDGIAALEDWVDTGVDAIVGEKITVSSAGMVNLLGSYQTAPDGNTSFGNRGGLMVGCVVGRIGSDKKPFAIGSTKSWAPKNSGRLYVKIYCNDDLLNNNQLSQTSGSYTVHINSGVWAGDAIPAVEANK